MNKVYDRKFIRMKTGMALKWMKRCSTWQKHAFKVPLRYYFHLIGHEDKLLLNIVLAIEREK